MPLYLERLLGKSFEAIPGEYYNQYRQDVLDGVDRSYLFYELSLMEERAWEYLRDQVYPAFARYLRAKRLEPTSGHGVVVAVFHVDTCYLLRGEDFLMLFQEMEGLDATGFAVKVHSWL